MGYRSCGRSEGSARGHFLLNGRKTDIPSARVKSGDVIQVREKSKDKEVIKTALEQPSLALPDWISLEVDARKATISSDPSAESVPFPGRGPTQRMDPS